MGLRFRKSIKLCKGVKLNLGTKSASVSVGGKGFHQTFSTTGRTTSSVGIPGTGVSYQKSFSLKDKFSELFGGKKKESASKQAQSEKEAKAAAKQQAANESAEAARQRVAEFEAAVDELRSIHKVCDICVDWNNVRAPGLKVLSGRILKGDTDAYLEAVELAGAFDDLVEYGSEFEVGTDDPDVLEVEFVINSEETIPEKVLSLTETGKLSEKQMSATMHYELLQDYVCSTMLRIARDSFALLPVKKVVVHASDIVVNTATGNDEQQTYVSAVFDRAAFDNINFERIDPSDTVGSFKCNMDFKKTKGFKPVEKMEV
ncbi:MAG: DUF4236 domain-containing protein [Lachnospiraceae bacterium]|nr:DUF4236 domain-containing protein [Lachnospiraceae bacterium]